MALKTGRSTKIVRDYEKSGAIGKNKPTPSNIKKVRNGGVVRTIKKRDGNYPVKIY